MASMYTHRRALPILVGLLASVSPGRAQQPTVLLQPSMAALDSLKLKGKDVRWNF